MSLVSQRGAPASHHPHQHLVYGLRPCRIKLAGQMRAHATAEQVSQVQTIKIGSRGSKLAKYQAEQARIWSVLPCIRSSKTLCCRYPPYPCSHPLTQQVTLLLRKVRPEWTSENFQTVPFVTPGDQQTEIKLRELGQGAFTGGPR